MDDIEDEYTVGSFKPGEDTTENIFSLVEFLNRYFGWGYALVTVDPPYYIFRKR